MRRAVFVALLAVCYIVSTAVSSTDDERRKVLLDLISDDKTSTAGFYNSLSYNITPLDRDGDLYKDLSQYFVATQVLKPVRLVKPNWTYELFSVTDVFTLTKRKLAASSNIDNKMLLWHGSPLELWKKILKEGFQIDKAKTSGNFGAGGYFADSSSKGCSYCNKGNNTRPRGVTMLAEVALGRVKELRFRHKYGPGKLPAGKDSVKGLGELTPDPSTFWKMGDVLVPSGKLKNISDGRRFDFNEYVVYDDSQITIRYLATVKLINSSPLLSASTPMLAFSSGFIILIQALSYC